MATNVFCMHVHRFILAGTCPWCASLLVEHRPTPGMAGEDSMRRWDIPALIHSLDHDNNSASLMLISSLHYQGPDTSQLLPALRRALENSDERVRLLAADVLTHRGQNLSGRDPGRFEAELRDLPGDRALRILLLGYYSPRASLSESARAACREYMLWMIANTPELAFPAWANTSLARSVDGGANDELEERWQQQIQAHPQNAAILRNAAAYFTHHNPRLSIELLQKLQKLEPDRPECERVAFLYRRLINGYYGETRREEAVGALVELENMLSSSAHPTTRWWVLPDLGNIALEAGDLEKAQSYATELLEVPLQADDFFPEIGAAVHDANLILGRLALKVGNIPAAKRYLVEAAKTDGSPLLESTGPNMMLAKELLEQGEREAVIDYLRLCASFWQTADHRAEQWIYTLQHGGNPDFGDNLW